MADLIDRQAAIDALSAILDNPNHAEFLYGDEICKTLQDLPSAERRGRWIKSEIPNEKYVCSVCGGACWYYDVEGDVAKSAYCPNCGSFNGESDELQEL